MRDDTPQPSEPQEPARPEEGPQLAPTPPQPAPEEAQEPVGSLTVQVEPRLGLTEYHAVAAAGAGWTPAVTKAAEAALVRWMRAHGQDANGHYPQEEWAVFYKQMLAA